ncbi:nitroreductase family deazaflavin-dependent oxidoreductase [Amycolatopsis acidiphila]|uniref:Nitroreductase family deazaflavin-dependent oxidoreductase n=1 Tax=Amycolatopsis acidiphila TaxID=715473 RepID=A0A557ZRF2_9PSEU|nr:nitroreductase family deazaflavin-dependent oxidoreductase [Amycolatopsis acidiphila]TVT14595.1 nitroreductase family deazaflavin-dependent oxidoreductase [Amycolatopsis acidiphila]UIJ63861.1 nitroreductase family deazaflavin-dependent oxidoreductase [Amycolatopsis acidiphila]
MRTAKAVPWIDKRLHRVSGGRLSLLGMAGLPSMRLTTVGRKSGQPRTVNLLYFPHGDEFVLIGSNWGRPRDPDWARNLRAQPKAVVDVRRQEVPVLAAEVTGERYPALWQEVLDFWPGYGMEQAAAGRELPLFVLTRR